MTFSRLIRPLCACLFSIALLACDSHRWEDTQKLYKHDSHHGEAHDDEHHSEDAHGRDKKKDAHEH